MRIFAKLLPEDVALLDLPGQNKDLRIAPWLEQDSASHFLKVWQPDRDYLVEMKDGSFKGIALRDQDLGALRHSKEVIDSQDKSEIARQHVENPKALIKTNSTSIIWNFNAPGYLFDPYYPLSAGVVNLPDGAELSLRNNNLSIIRAKAWFDHLEEDYKDFFGKKPFGSLARLSLKCALRAGQMNLSRRKGGNVNDFLIKNPDMTKTDGKVRGKIMRAGNTPLKEMKRKHTMENNQLAIRDFRCPLGDKCRYAVAGQICQHNKEAFKIAQYFKTRDPDLITENLASLLSIESERYGKVLALEQDGADILGFASAIGNDLFNKAIAFLKIVKPEFDTGRAINIFNTQINASQAAVKLEQAGMNDDQRQSLAEEIEGIIKEKRRQGARGA